MPTIICPHCGVNNRTGSNFCNNCGTELRESDPQEKRQPHKNESTYSEPAADSESIMRPIDRSAERQLIDPSPNESKDSTVEERSSGDEKDAPALPPPKVQGRQTEKSHLQSDDKIEPAPIRKPAESNVSSSEILSSNVLPQRGVGSGIPGLLEPQTIIGENIEQIPRSQATGELIDDADLRRIQTLMTSEPSQRVEAGKNNFSITPSVHVPWIFALLALAVAIPIFLEFSTPSGVGNQLPGVAAAFQTIDRLDKPIALVLWEYDPATAGELDQVVEPVLRHLEDRQYQVVLASTLPTGPATARRMLRDVHNGQGRNGLLTLLDLGYLPGGSAVLPLLGQDRGMILPPEERTPSALLNSPLDLVLIASARAEEVQQWLEQGQPLNPATTVAVTSAAADPYLRPFLDSGQLSGIVSGFDGGIAYQQLYNRSASANTTAADAMPSPQQFRQQVYQNWGHLTILLLILLGNFSMLSNRSAEKRQAKDRQIAEHKNA